MAERVRRDIFLSEFEMPSERRADWDAPAGVPPRLSPSMTKTGEGTIITHILGTERTLNVHPVYLSTEIIF